jgi:hypothetical protein
MAAGNGSPFRRHFVIALNSLLIDGPEKYTA